MARARAQQNVINKMTAEMQRRDAGIRTRKEIQQEQLQMFTERAMELHKGRYSYELCTGDDTIIICSIHGQFRQSRAAHLRGQGCPMCARVARAEKSRLIAREAAETFTAKANTMHSSRYSYEHVRYVNVHTKVQIDCSVHGQFLQTPAAHLNGQGCPDCANERRAAFAESNGEQTIAKWLEDHNVMFVKQKTFDDCRDQMLLRYDFYVPNCNLLIEFDGQQHFEFVKKFHGSEDRFLKCQERDKIKNEYAKKREIDLLRIKYLEEKQIDKILYERIIG